MAEINRIAAVTSICPEYWALLCRLGTGPWNSPNTGSPTGYYRLNDKVTRYVYHTFMCRTWPVLRKPSASNKRSRHNQFCSVLGQSHKSTILQRSHGDHTATGHIRHDIKCWLSLAQSWLYPRPSCWVNYEPISKLRQIIQMRWIRQSNNA